VRLVAAARAAAALRVAAPPGAPAPVVAPASIALSSTCPLRRARPLQRLGLGSGMGGRGYNTHLGGLGHSSSRVRGSAPAGCGTAPRQEKIDDFHRFSNDFQVTGHSPFLTIHEHVYQQWSKITRSLPAVISHNSSGGSARCSLTWYATLR
jgi:hypothetical protein